MEAQNSKPGTLLVISGPSGVGKGTVCQELLRREPSACFSVSATTRAPRENEIEGVSYYFVSEAQFQEMLDRGEFLEWAQVFGHRYGTPRFAVERLLAQGRNVLLDIDTQGADQVRRAFPQAVSVFILPPSLAELRRRIEGRGTETAAAVARRLAGAESEMARAGEYDHRIVNLRVKETADRLQEILAAQAAGC